MSMIRDRSGVHNVDERIGTGMVQLRRHKVFSSVCSAIHGI